MTAAPPRRRRYIAIGLATLATFGALTACSASSDSGLSTNAAAPAGPAGKADTAGGAGSAADGGVAAEVNGAPGAPVDPQKPSAPDAQAPIAAQQRSLIYTGTISVKVADVRAAADKAIDVAGGMGGSVGSDKRSLDSTRSQATLVLRVPSEKFNSALGELGKLGDEESRSVDTQDVTENLVDLDARLNTQRASVERVRALLAKAQTIGEVVSIESELTRREADLDSLEQRKAKLAGLVALSTITVDLRGPDAPTPTGEQPDPGFLAGLRNGWSAFVDSIKVVLVVAGWLLPWAIAIGIPVWLILYVLRRRKRPATNTPTA